MGKARKQEGREGARAGKAYLRGRVCVVALVLPFLCGAPRPAACGDQGTHSPRPCPSSGADPKVGGAVAELVLPWGKEGLASWAR